MAGVVEIIGVVKLLTTCKETSKSRGLCERLQGSIDDVKELIQAPQSKYAQLNCIFDQLREHYFVDVQGEVTWYFTSLCLCLLEALKTCLDQLLVTDTKQPSRKLQYPELSPNILSIQQQKIVQAMVQFIIMLGISPYQLPGVGVPLKHRTRSPDAIATLKQLQQSTRMTNEQRAWHLYKCCTVLVQCVDQPSLRAAIFPTHLIDVISALLQICNGPHDVLPSNKLPSNTKYTSPADIKPLMVTNSNHNIGCISVEQREESNEILEKLLDKMYPPLVISQLLTLQSIAYTDWTVKGCGRLLSRQLMKPHGIQALIEATFSNVRGDSQRNWKKAEGAAKIVARCPLQVTSLMEYYNIVCPQVVSLLRQDNGVDYLQVLVAIINAMISENEPITMEYIIKPLSSPLCSFANGDLRCHGDQFCQTFKILHQVVSIATLSSSVLVQLVPYLPVLVRVVMATEESTDKQLQMVNEKSKQIIVTLLKSMDNDKCCQFIQSIVYGPLPNQYVNIDNDISLHHKDGIIATTNERIMDSSSMEQTNKLLQYLFQELNDKALEAEVFVNCFQHLCNNLLQLSPGDKVLGYEKSVVLLVVSDMCEHKVDQLLTQLGMTKMLTLSSQLLQCHCDAMEKHHISFHDNHSNDLDNKIFGGQITMSIALGIVTMVMTSSQKDLSGNNIDKQLISTILSLLRKISESYPVEELRTMATELSICLATLGAVKGTLSPRQPTSSNKPLIEEISKPDVTKSIPESKLNSEVDTPFQCALKEVQDILLPVRGHGVQMLSKLIRCKDPETIENVAKLLTIFQEQLRSDDSYVYLRAISGLAALASVKPNDVIPLLCREFSCLANVKLQSQKFATGHDDDKGSCDKAEVTLKVGEVLVKVAKECNEMLPHYSNHFLTAIMSGVKAIDPLVQASSLSSLATVCQHLGYSLGPVQHEVLKCVQDALVASGNQQVKRAAIQTLHLILKGLGHRCIEVLGDSLRDIYQLLKRVAMGSHDAMTTEHAHAALDQLNNVMKQSLCSHDPTNITKNISVLS